MSDVIVGVLSTTLLTLLASGVHWLNQYIKSHYKPQQLSAVYDLARTSVAAAQEVGVVKNFDGDTKLQYAKGALLTAARKVGVKLTDAELSTFIHAALREMKQVTAFSMPGA